MSRAETPSLRAAGGDAPRRREIASAVQWVLPAGRLQCGRSKQAPWELQAPLTMETAALRVTHSAISILLTLHFLIQKLLLVYLLI